jgi:hypothetical protein
VIDPKIWWRWIILRVFIALAIAGAAILLILRCR